MCFSSALERFDADGVSEVVINLAREAAKHENLRPIIFCADPSQGTFQVGETEGITLVSGRLRAPLSGAQPGRNLATFAHKLRDELRIWRAFLEKYNVRVVNAHHPSLDYSVFALLRTRRAKIRLLFSLHGTDVTAVEKSGVAARPIARWMLKKADRIICCSEALRKRAQVSLKLDERRLTTIHNGIDVSELDQAKTNVYKPDVGGFDNYLLNVASYEHRKGQDIRPACLSQTCCVTRLKSALVLIGRSTPYLQNLRGMARRTWPAGPRVLHPRPSSTARHSALSGMHACWSSHLEKRLSDYRCWKPVTSARQWSPRAGGVPEVLGGYSPTWPSPTTRQHWLQLSMRRCSTPPTPQRQVKLMKRRVATGLAWTAYIPSVQIGVVLADAAHMPKGRSADASTRRTRIVQQ